MLKATGKKDCPQKLRGNVADALILTPLSDLSAHE